MRKSVPLQWIEHAEARAVLTLARSETTARPLSPSRDRAGIAWPARLRLWRLGASPASADGSDTADEDQIDLKGNDLEAV